MLVEYNGRDIMAVWRGRKYHFVGEPLEVPEEDAKAMLRNPDFKAVGGKKG